MSVEIKVGSLWCTKASRAVWRVADIERGDGAKVALSDPRNRLPVITRDREYFLEKFEPVPEVGSRWTHALGAHVTVTKIKYGRDATPGGEYCEIRTMNGLGESRAWALKSFFEQHTRQEYRPTAPAVPAKPESRWLDPQSVPVGPPMRTCAFCEVYIVTGISRRLCCYDLATNESESAMPAVLPPSVLTPAPRVRLPTSGSRVAVFDIFNRHSEKDERFEVSVQRFNGSDPVGGVEVGKALMAYGYHDLRQRFPKKPRVKRVWAPYGKAEWAVLA